MESSKMRNFFLAIFLTAGLGALAESFFPWWSLAVVAAILGFAIPQKRVAAWFSALIGGFCLWLGYAIYLSNVNDNILLGRVTELFADITAGKAFRLYFLTAAIGGLVAGFASLTGRLLAVLVFPKQVELG